MHMLCKKDLTAELGTLRVSRNLTKVSTASGSIETIEEATVYAKDLDLFVTVKLLNDTLAVLSLRKTLRGSWVLLRIENVTSATFHEGWQNNCLQVGKLRACRCSFINRSSY